MAWRSARRPPLAARARAWLATRATRVARYAGAGWRQFLPPQGFQPPVPPPGLACLDVAAIVAAVAVLATAVAGAVLLARSGNATREVALAMPITARHAAAGSRRRPGSVHMTRQQPGGRR